MKQTSFWTNLQSKIEAFKAKRKRKKLIRSAKLKVAREGNAKNVTADEWNALAYEPLQKARRELQERCPFWNEDKK